MAKDRVNMPMSGAGLTRYFEDYKSKLDFKPGHILVVAVLVILIVLLLHMSGAQLLGF
ncbi:MAG: preprotein translocase subunit Sec61beta [Nanoarchaeota archaeon]|nr:preprotein translocase subunit Sec61beta [Nanoarchaeota archaeon]